MKRYKSVLTNSEHSIKAPENVFDNGIKLIEKNEFCKVRGFESKYQKKYILMITSESTNNNTVIKFNSLQEAQDKKWYEK